MLWMKQQIKCFWKRLEGSYKIDKASITQLNRPAVVAFYKNLLAPAQVRLLSGCKMWLIFEIVCTPALIKCVHCMATVPTSSRLTWVKCLNWCSVEAQNNFQCVCLFTRFQLVLFPLLNLSNSFQANVSRVSAACVSSTCQRCICGNTHFWERVQPELWL